MPKLKLGTKVTLSPHSMWYGDEDVFSDNPMNTKGQIVELLEYSQHCYSVQWSNGTDNLYMEGELECSA